MRGWWEPPPWRSSSWHEVRGAEAVLALVLLQWTTGWAGVAAWTQSWQVVRRGHLRITAWVVLALALLTVPVFRAAVPAFPVPVDAPDQATPLQPGEIQNILVTAVAVAAGLFAAAQYLKSDRAGVATGGLLTALGAAALVTSGDLIVGWTPWLAALSLLAGALFLGAVANGMMLGHWYLNQPGLKPWALARLTHLALSGVAASAVLGIATVRLLAGATTEGAVLGLTGFGSGFGVAFFLVWLALLGFSGVVVWMARRCVKIRSIQSATGLYYVALLTSGTSEFVVRYLMVNAS